MVRRTANATVRAPPPRTPYLNASNNGPGKLRTLANGCRQGYLTPYDDSTALQPGDEDLCRRPDDRLDSRYRKYKLSQIDIRSVSLMLPAEVILSDEIMPENAGDRLQKTRNPGCNFNFFPWMPDAIVRRGHFPFCIKRLLLTGD